jgi:HAD superfamily hydrolase (TIGR01509 family)
MIKAVIFDCFGVLLQDWLGTIIKKYPVDTQIHVWDAVKMSNMGFIDYREGIRQMAAALGMTEDELQQNRHQNEVRNQELLEQIPTLRTKGYKTAVLSNISAGGITRRFSEDELTILFDAVVESGSVGFTKPDKNAYKYTAEKLGLQPSECVMVDDREDFCAGAVDAGMSSILYRDFMQYRIDLQALLADSNM